MSRSRKNASFIKVARGQSRVRIFRTLKERVRDIIQRTQEANHGLASERVINRHIAQLNRK